MKEKGNKNEVNKRQRLARNGVECKLPTDRLIPWPSRGPVRVYRKIYRATRTYDLGLLGGATLGTDVFSENTNQEEESARRPAPMKSSLDFSPPKPDEMATITSTEHTAMQMTVDKRGSDFEMSTNESVNFSTRFHRRRPARFRLELDPSLK